MNNKSSENENISELQKKEDSLLILNFIEQSQSKPLYYADINKPSWGNNDDEYQDLSNNILYASNQFLKCGEFNNIENLLSEKTEKSASDTDELRPIVVHNIIDIPEDELVLIKGYIKRIICLSEKYKRQASLEQYLGLETHEKIGEDDSSIYLLDKTGKVTLQFFSQSFWRFENKHIENAIDPGILINFLEVTACGIYDSEKFKVYYLVLPSLPPQKPYPYISAILTNPEHELPPAMGSSYFIAILSGLNLKGGNDQTELRNLEHFLMTNRPKESIIGSMLDKTLRIIIAGDHIYEDDDMVMSLQGGYKVTGLFSSVFQNVGLALSRFQDFINLISSRYLVDIMPGDKDANEEIFFPQRNSEMSFTDFFDIFEREKVNFVSNPYLFEEKSVRVLVSSGQNIKNLLKYSPFEHKTECELMEWNLYWKNISPLSCSKAIGFEECQTLEELPHIYIMGNANFFEEKLFFDEDNNKIVKLICLPDFETLPRIYFVSLDNLEVLKIVLNTELDELS